MGVDELALRGMRGQLVDELARLVVGHAADRAGVAGDVEAHAARIGQAADQHLGHRREGGAFALVEILEAELAARRHDRVLGDQPRDALLGGVRQRIVGRTHVGELGMAADRRDRARMQHRAVGRQALERRVRVPEAIAEIVETLAVVRLEDAVFGVEIADIGHVLVQAQVMALARHEDGRLQWTEMACEGELAVVVEFLVGEDQNRILCESLADRGEVLGRDLVQGDIADFGHEVGRHGMDRHSHRASSLLLLMRRIGSPNGQSGNRGIYFQP